MSDVPPAPPVALPFPFETENFTIVPLATIEEDDFAEFGRKNPETFRRYAPNAPAGMSSKEIALGIHFEDRSNYFGGSNTRRSYAILTKTHGGKSPEIAGFGHLVAFRDPDIEGTAVDVGIGLGTAFFRQGYGREINRPVTHHILTAHTNVTVAATIRKSNKRSANLVEKSGFEIVRDEPDRTLYGISDPGKLPGLGLA